MDRPGPAHHPRTARTRGAGDRRWRRRAVLTSAATAPLLLAACDSSDGGGNSVAGQATAGNDRAYVSGNGAIQQIPPDRRNVPVKISGTTLTGKPWTLTPNGKITVLNMWGSWCGPCVAEAPDLEKAWQELRHKPVQFMGLDFKEGPAAGLAFVRKYHITYPSLADDGGKTQLALQGQAPTVPTTLILDRRDRIAARVLGRTTTDTITGLVQDLLPEGATK